ncbi:MAG: stage III sporulation protein AF [Oscillospiraceae bacterium]|jgi:hypothetical protein|nr:stage III sporulation protein AF [Oscillospiraceae bacterium]
MDGLRAWALTVALSALAGGIVWMLAPKGSVQKALRTVTAVFVLCSFLSPFFAGEDLPLQWIAPEISQSPALPSLDDTIQAQLQDAVKTELTNQLQAILKENHADGAEILITTAILSDSSISIEQVVILLQKNHASKADSLKKSIKSQTGLDAEITAKEATQTNGGERVESERITR